MTSYYILNILTLKKRHSAFWTSLSFGEVYFLIENPSVTYLFYDWRLQILNETVNKSGLCSRSRVHCKFLCHLTDLIELQVSLEDRDRLIRILQGSVIQHYRKWQYGPLVFLKRNSKMVNLCYINSCNSHIVQIFLLRSKHYRLDWRKM